MGKPSLADDPRLFKQLSDDLFGTGAGVHELGKGRVFAGQSVQTALEALKVKPDFEYAQSRESQQILYVHRKLPDGDLYFVNNRSEHEVNVDGAFRVTVKAP